MTERVVTATEFKAKCPAYLDEIEHGGAAITITRRGRPVATLTPAKKTAWKSPRNSWARRMEIVGDIVNADPSTFWDCLSEHPFGIDPPPAKKRPKKKQDA